VQNSGAADGNHQRLGHHIETMGTPLRVKSPAACGFPLRRGLQALQLRTTWLHSPALAGASVTVDGPRSGKRAVTFANGLQTQPHSEYGKLVWGTGRIRAITTTSRSVVRLSRSLGSREGWSRVWVRSTLLHAASSKIDGIATWRPPPTEHSPR